GGESDRTIVVAGSDAEAPIELQQAWRMYQTVRSPYDEVRKKGAIGLRALGETLADPRPSYPVAFRILVDGKPVGQRQVEWTLRTGEWEESSSTESDEEGVDAVS